MKDIPSEKCATSSDLPTVVSSCDLYILSICLTADECLELFLREGTVQNFRHNFDVTVAQGFLWTSFIFNRLTVEYGDHFLSCQINIKITADFALVHVAGKQSSCKGFSYYIDQNDALLFLQIINLS